MDCCSADGYAATYTQLLKKLTGDNEILAICVIIVVLCILTRIACKSRVSKDTEAKKDN